MVKVCTRCGVTAAGYSQCVKVFAKSSAFSTSISNTCKRCDSLRRFVGGLSKIVGDYCLLQDNPNKNPRCKCCNKELNPLNHTKVCKDCRAVATIVVGLLDSQEEITREYYIATLESIFTAVLGFIPRKYGYPVDVLNLNIKIDKIANPALLLLKERIKYKEFIWKQK